MKTHLKIMAAFILTIAASGAVNAQNQTRKEKQAAKAEEVRKMVEASNYTFEANSALSQGGHFKQLTGVDYDLKITKDTIIAYLPYFGRAYVAPSDPTEGGIKFTSTNFNYSSKQVKNGSWEIHITKNDKNVTDMRDVQQMWLHISPSGYASLQVISSNRDPISFEGQLLAAKDAR